MPKRLQVIKYPDCNTNYDYLKSTNEVDFKVYDLNRPDCNEKLMNNQFDVRLKNRYTK